MFKNLTMKVNIQRKLYHRNFDKKEYNFLNENFIVPKKKKKLESRQFR